MSFRRLSWRRIFEAATPCMGMLSSFLRSLSCPSRSAAEIPFWHSRMRWKMSMMLSLESPGESRPRERRNFFVSSLLSAFCCGFSYFRSVISARGISLETLMGVLDGISYLNVWKFESDLLPKKRSHHLLNLLLMPEKVYALQLMLQPD